MTKIRLKDDECPACGAELNGASRVAGTGIKPEPGSLSICAYCHVGLAFSDDMTLRRATAAELDDIWAALLKTEPKEKSADEPNSETACS